MSKLSDENIDYQDPFFNTPILLACQSGLDYAFDALIARGANLTAVNANGRNCLHFVFEENNWWTDFALSVIAKLGDQALELFLAADVAGKTPLDLMLEDGTDPERARLVICAVPGLSEHLLGPETESMVSLSLHDSCLICREVLEIGDMICTLPCKHCYHENCYSEWSQQRDICPYCRQPSLRKK